VKILKVLQVVGVLMLGIGIGVGFKDGDMFWAAIGLLLFSGAKVTYWIQSKKD